VTSIRISACAFSKLLAIAVSAGILVCLIATTILSDAAAGDTVQAGDGLGFEIFGSMTPTTLPRLLPVPATLRIGFNSEVIGRYTPELGSIAFDLSRNISLQTTGLPSCPLNRLLSRYENSQKACHRSLVGHGRVISEVELPRQGPVTINGTLLAFYDVAKGQPRILAQVTSDGTPPLTYVIPFAIEKGSGPFRTSLAVHRMRDTQGICAEGHPSCFAQPYTLKGIYSQISNFELTLHRIFSTRQATRESFVGADCPAPGHRSSEDFTLEEVKVRYTAPFVESQSAVKPGGCKVAG